MNNSNQIVSGLVYVILEKAQKGGMTEKRAEELYNEIYKPIFQLPTSDSEDILDQVLSLINIWE